MLLLMLLTRSTTAAAQDATLNFNYVNTGQGAGTYTVLGTTSTNLFSLTVRCKQHPFAPVHTRFL